MAMRNGNTPSDPNALNKLRQLALELLDDVRRAVLALPLPDEHSFTVEEAIDDAIEQLQQYYQQLKGEDEL